MLHFTRESLNVALKESRCDAVALEIDCFGGLHVGGVQTADVAADFSGDAVGRHVKTLLDAGAIHPGELLHRKPDEQIDKHVFLLPMRVHPSAPVRLPYIETCVEELVEHCLRHAIGSVLLGHHQVSREENLANGLATNVRLHVLRSFARAPKIELRQPLGRNHSASGQHVTIFTDGGAKSNPNRGGYGVVLRFGERSKELSAGFRNTNAGRMELMAAVAGLEALKHRCHVRLHTDSQYLIHHIQHGKLFRSASAQGSISKQKNRDLWERFLLAYLRHDVEMIWVKGHSGIDDNERCDELATAAMQQDDLPLDRVPPANASKPKSKKKPNPNPVQPLNRVPIPGSTKPQQEGDPCRYCGTKLIKRVPKKHKANAAYHFAWYLYCESCARMYMVEAAKIQPENGD